MSTRARRWIAFVSSASRFDRKIGQVRVFGSSTLISSLLRAKDGHTHGVLHLTGEENEVCPICCSTSARAVPVYFIEMQPRTSEYLFARDSKPIRDFRESWDLACQRAGVPDLLFHDLRRTAVRNLRRAGVPETVTMKITGHRARSVFEEYNITDETDTQKAGRKAEAFLAREQEEVAQNTSQKPERIN
jgi:integrase